MPTIDIPDVLAFGKLEALRALHKQVKDEQQKMRRDIVKTCREARTRFDSTDVVPDLALDSELQQLRAALAQYRGEWTRLSRVAENLTTQIQAEGGSV